MALNIGGAATKYISLLNKGDAFEGTIVDAYETQSREYGTGKPLFWGADNKPTTEDTGNVKNEIHVKVNVTKIRGSDKVEVGDDAVWTLTGSKFTAAVALTKTGEWDGDLDKGRTIKVIRGNDARNAKGFRTVEYAITFGPKPTAAPDVDLADPWATDVSTKADTIPF